MEGWAKYRKIQIDELRPYAKGEQLGAGVKIAPEDRDTGSPKDGDMLARDPEKPDEQWLVSGRYFNANYERVA